MRGHIRKYKGRWAGVIELDRDPVTNKRRQKWVYSDTKKECEQKVNDYIHQIENNSYIEADKATVAEYLEIWLNLRKANLAVLTYQGYERYIEKHINPEIGNLKLQKLNAMNLQTFYAKKQEKLSGKTVLQIHRILHKAFEDARTKRLIATNPASDVEAPKAKKFEMELIDKNQYLKMLKAVEGTMDEIIIVLAGGLGLRRGEVLGLKWRYVDFQKKTISIKEQLLPSKDGLVFEEPKSLGSKRTIQTPKYILKLLKKHKRNQNKDKLFFGSEYKDNDLVCCKPDGDLINPSSYSRQFKILLETNGLQHMRFHDLRHFNATMMMNYGVPEKVASTRLGHSSTAITQDLYQHVLEDKDTEAADILDQALFQQ